MVQYNDELKEEIRAANDIVDVVSQYTTLVKKGRNYFCVCPFHSEKSPSMSVSPERQYFHCFGCNAGGDVFSFISKIENLTFRESVEFLAERAKIQLPSLNNQDDQKQYMKNRMYQINAEATLFFHERLYTPFAKIAQDYVKKRKLDNKTLQAFKIGYSGEFNELYKFLKQKGFKDEEILATGLCNRNDRGEFIDRYRKRLMFPIMNIQGKVVAFGGRRLDEDKNVPKYINSNENLVYSKKMHLFALNLAKQNNPKKIILVEGYMDVISLHQRGITNVVASLGTALTEEQGKLLRKYEQVVLSYDSDEAGQNAIMRGLDVLQKLGVDGRVLQIEGAKDPDEFVIEFGTGRFNLLVDNAISLIEFKSQMISKNYNMENATDKIKFLKELSKLLSQVDNKLERQIYIDKIAQQNKISKEALYAEVNKIVYDNSVNEKILEKAKPMLKSSDSEIPEQTISTAILKRENMILYLLINNFEEAGQIIKETISKDDFKHETNRRIFEEIYKVAATGEKEIYKVLSNIEDEDFQSTLSQIIVSDYEIVSVQKCIEDVIKNYSRDKLNSRKIEIINKLSDKTLSKEESSNLEIELNQIIIELARKK
ncbi:MAG: DNA primase [Clostridia bacterium]|nr:DNA primase [Clostridia bacterium]